MIRGAVTAMRNNKRSTKEGKEQTRKRIVVRVTDSDSDERPDSRHPWSNDDLAPQEDVTQLPTTSTSSQSYPVSYFV